MPTELTSTYLSSLTDAELLDALRDQEIELRQLHALHVQLIAKFEAHRIRKVFGPTRGGTGPPPSSRSVQSAATNDGRRDM